MTAPRRRIILDTSEILHKDAVEYWRERVEEHARRNAHLSTCFERIIQSLDQKASVDGDALVAKIRDTFHNGMGIQWSVDQVRVFDALLFSALPLIYGDSWGENKARVLAEWNEKGERPYTLVSMARRNGKTYVTAGAVVAFLICVPNIKIAIFATCKRTAGMLMSAAVDMLQKAFDKGTHCSPHDFVPIVKNMESIVYEGPDKTKRTLGCFPGSVRVRKSCFCVSGGMQRPRVQKIKKVSKSKGTKNQHLSKKKQKKNLRKRGPIRGKHLHIDEAMSSQT